MRTFIALELPEEFVGELAQTARVLSSSVEGRFMPRSNYHVTLAFLGEIHESEVRLVMDAIDEACQGIGAVGLSCNGLGTFGRASDATLWLGLDPDQGLSELAVSVRAKLAARGAAFDDKPFRPHITLARRARIPRGILPELPFPAPVAASRVTLFRSVLSKDGATYKPIYTVDLG